MRIAVAGQRRVVELQIGAPLGGEVRELVAIQLHQIRKEGVPVRVHASLEGLRAEEVMHHRRRGDGRLGPAAPHRRPEEAIVVRDDTVLAPEGSPGIRGRGHANDAAFIPEGQSSVAQPETVNRIDEPRRPAAAAELAVGDRRQAEQFLEGHDLADAFILDVLKFLFIQAFRLVRARRLEQGETDRKSTRLNSSHLVISYAVFCLKKKKKKYKTIEMTS